MKHFTLCNLQHKSHLSRQMKSVASLFIVILFKILFKLIKVLLENISEHYTCLFSNIAACIVAYLVYAVSEKTIISEINLMSLFLWLMLGYAFMCIKFCVRDGTLEESSY